MNEAASRLAQLSPQKLALLLGRVKQKEDPTCIRAIPRQAGINRFPASYAQQRLWLLDQLNPGTALNNMPAAWTISGPLNVEALQAALAELCRRHETLRTTFSMQNGQLMQVVKPAEMFPLSIRNLTGLPQPERRPEVLRIAAEWTRLPFDLEQGPLMRACLLILNHEQHALLLTLHHIITDGWSFTNLGHELSVLYGACSRAEESPLPELEIQYGDYSVWQRQRLQGEVFEQQLAYWKEQLQGVPALTELPLDRPRGPLSNHCGGYRVLNLSQELTERINALNQRAGVTLFMSTLAAFQLLLSRYSGQDDICVGSPLAGRRHRQTEHLIGFFINTLVLRTKLSGDPTFNELLARVRETYLGAHAHQDIPFEKLVVELRPDQSQGQTPFFQVWFALQNIRQERPQLDGLVLRPLGTGVRRAQFELAMILWEEAGRIGCALIWDEDLFDAETAEQILKDYEALLQQVTANPECRISKIPFDTNSNDGAFGGDSLETDEQFLF